MAKNLYSFHSLINGVQKDGYRTLAKKPQTSNLPYVFFNATSALADLMSHFFKSRALLYAHKIVIYQIGNKKAEVPDRHAVIIRRKEAAVCRELLLFAMLFMQR